MEVWRLLALLEVVVLLIILALAIALLILYCKNNTPCGYATAEGYMPQFRSVDKRTIEELRAELREVVPGIEDIDIVPGECSLTVEKRRIELRMRDRQGKPYTRVVLRYALLHEMAHVLSPTWGDDNHTFRKQEDRLYRRAFALGLLPAINWVHLNIPDSYLRDCDRKQ